MIERDLEDLLRKMSDDILGNQKSIDDIKTELGIKWPNQAGLKSRIDAL